MDEADWLANADPYLLLKSPGVKVSNRRWMLFASACYRRIWHLLNDEFSRKAIDVAEQLADGLAEHQELVRAIIRVRDFIEASSQTRTAQVAVVNGPFREVELTWSDVNYGIRLTASAMATDRHHRIAEYANQTRLLRDIIGNPFRPALPVPPAILAWNDAIVRRIAEGIYQERRMPEGTLDTGRLAILHDALLDAGCDNEEVLTHLRSEGPHIRGCWAIDLLLGKE